MHSARHGDPGAFAHHRYGTAVAILKFTHTVDMPWMLPGVAPTGRRVEIPMVLIIQHRAWA
jgi:hypothetical protein